MRMPSLTAAGSCLAVLAVPPPARANFVSAKNRLGHEPMRLQLGYDPSSHLPRGGLAVTF